VSAPGPAGPRFALRVGSEGYSAVVEREGTLWDCEGVGDEARIETLLPALARLFERAGIEPGACVLYAYDAGPGAFTALRLACTVVQGLALPAGAPVCAVPGADVMLAAALEARAASAAPGTDLQPGACVVTLSDARLQAAYATRHVPADSGWHGGESLEWALAELPQRLAQAGAGAVAGPPSWLSGLALPAGLQIWPAPAHARHVLGLALARASSPAGATPASHTHAGAAHTDESLPRYVRDRVALTTRERRDRALGAQP
jgi:tRNA threonylcarbamoyladenosine biosynthesis protein TsaB